MKYSKCVVCYEYVGWVGLASNMALSLLKIFVGVFAGSQALVADAMYSAKDVITSILIIFGLKISNQPVDKEHPYGHGKIEFIFSAIISVLFLCVTGVLFFYAAESLMEGEHAAPHIIALWTAVFAVAASSALYFYTRCVGREINSPMVQTLSKHYRADGIASMAVACGIIGAHYLGLLWLDAVIALFETLHLLYLGGEIFWDSFQGLIDTAAPKEVVRKIEKTTQSVEGVKTIDNLKTRLVGQNLWVDMVVGIEPELSIAEARAITEKIEDELSMSISHLGSATVHFKSTPGSAPEIDLVKAKFGKSKTGEVAVME